MQQVPAHVRGGWHRVARQCQDINVDAKPASTLGQCVHHVLCAAGTVGYGGLEEVEDSQMTNQALSAGNNKFIVLNIIQSLLGPANENLSVLRGTGPAL